MFILFTKPYKWRLDLKSTKSYTRSDKKIFEQRVNIKFRDKLNRSSRETLDKLRTPDNEYVVLEWRRRNKRFKKGRENYGTSEHAREIKCSPKSQIKPCLIVFSITNALFTLNILNKSKQ